jgi:hypothetical protein
VLLSNFEFAVLKAEPLNLAIWLRVAFLVVLEFEFAVLKAESLNLAIWLRVAFQQAFCPCLCWNLSSRC